MLARGKFVRSTSEVAHTKFLTNTDGSGRFAFPTVRAPHTVVAVASTGFGRTRVRAGQPTEVRLEPFGTIEGVMLRNGEPIPGQTVTLVDKSYDNYPGAMMLERANFQTRGDDQGHFQIRWIPAADLPLYLELAPVLGEANWGKAEDRQVTPSPFSRYGIRGRKADDTPVRVEPTFCITVRRGNSLG